MKTKRLLALLTAFVVAIAMMPAMVFADDATSAKSNDIVILATSDVHCGIDDNIGYAGLAAYKKAMEAQYNNVALVDAGDAVQGDVVGALSKGTLIRDILNEMKYDVLVPGNHEFDYGMDQFLNELAGKSVTPYISCNFVKDGKTVFDGYNIIQMGEKKVAFVGITTPETFFKSTPTFFQNEKGEYIYGFCQGNNGQDLYNAVQTAIDAAKAAGADYVIGVGHLGDEEGSVPYTSQDVIGNTTGLTAFVDGHAHHVFEKDIQSKDGKTVPIVATGTKLQNIGKIVISEAGTVTVANVTKTEASAKDAAMDEFVKDIKAKNDEITKQVVAKSNVILSVNDENGNRIVRKQETNIGDFCADAYLNVLGGDIALVNGGGIRADINVGDVTYGDIIKVHPWSNMGCLIEATGQQILDALELGSKDVGIGESGGFLQVAGMTYSIDPYLKSNVVLNEEGEFVKVDGERKVKDVKVNGVAIDPTKTYKVASHNYMLKQAGDGFTMFKGSKILKDEVKVDNEVLIDYVNTVLGGVIPEKYAQPEGRITLLYVDTLLGQLDEANAKLEKAEAELAKAYAKVEVANAKLALAKYTCKAKVKNYKSYSKITWKASKTKGIKYQVYKKVGKNYKLVKTTTKATYKTAKLAKGKKFSYKVRAIKKVNGKTYYGKFSKVVVAKRAA